MASATINGSTGNEYIDAKVVWSSTPNTTANKSTVTATLYYKRNNEGFTTYGTGTFSVTINGVKATSTKQLTITENAWVKAVEATVTVEHNDDGTKSITISATGSMSGTSLTSTSVSGTAILDTIPRASVIASAANVTLGKACNIKWTPNAKTFRYKLKFSLGEWSYTTAAIHPNQTSTYTYAGYTLPLSVANQLPKAKTGTMTVTLYTYSNSAATTQVGPAASKTFTATIPENDSTKPAAVMALSPVTSLASPFNTLYIKGKTKVKAAFTNGEGKYGADIASYSMKVLGKSYGDPYTSGYLSTSGSVTVEGVVTDTRGFTRKYTQTVTVIAYGNPTLLPAGGESKIICARCDANGDLTESGTYLKIKARRSYSTVTSGGVQNNFCTIRFRVREESSSSFSAWKTILAGTTLASDTADTNPIANVVSSTETAYVVQVGVIDDLGKTASVQFSVPTDFVTIDIPEEGKGRRIGVGRYAEDTGEPGIDLGMPIHGGSVDNLTLGEGITATEASPIDLNDFKTPGNYYSPNATNSQYIVNSPYTTGGFSLIVREIQSENMIRQELFYGRTNWQRHYSSVEGTWSEWLRYLMTAFPETTAADFVTEIGVWNVDDNDTNKGYWRYRVWKSGAVDMNGLVKVTPVTEGTLGTAGVYYSAVITLDLPFEVVNFQFTGSSTSYHCFVGNCNSVDGNNKQVRLRLYRFTDFSSLADYDVYVRIIASGKLK